MAGSSRDSLEVERGTTRLERRASWLGGTVALLLFVSVMAPYRTTVDEVYVVLPMLLLILLASSIGGERLGFFLAGRRPRRGSAAPSCNAWPTWGPRCCRP